MNFFKQGIAFLHRLEYKGQDIRIGHLDTGIDGAHPAFVGRIDAFRRFGYRGIAEEVVSAFDSGWHGTHTAGLMVGQSIGDSNFGIASNARLYAGMVIEEGNIISRILAGLDWLIDCKVQVVCLSLGVFNKTPVFKTLIQEMIRRDILVVSPIGNRGAGQASAPGYYPESLTVGAVDIDGNIPAFSGSFHQQDTIECYKPDILAPGVDILSAMPGGTIEEKSGTSMAAAQVAGLAALLRGVFPNLSNSIIKTALINSCDPLHPDQNHRAAAGMTNPIKAYDLLYGWSKEHTCQVRDANTNLEKTRFDKFVDSRLEMQIQMASEADLCEAVFEFENKEGIRDFNLLVTASNNGRFNNRNAVKILRHAPIIICQLPKKIIEQVIIWPSVCIASACDISRFI